MERWTKKIGQRVGAAVLAAMVMVALLPAGAVVAENEIEFTSFGVVEYEDETGIEKRILERRTVPAKDTSADFKVRATAFDENTGSLIDFTSITYTWEAVTDDTAGTSAATVTVDPADNSQATISFEENLTLSERIYQVRVTAAGTPVDASIGMYQSVAYIEVVQNPAIVGEVVIVKPADYKTTVLNSKGTVPLEATVTNEEGKTLTVTKEDCYWKVYDTVNFAITDENGTKATLVMTEAGKLSGSELFTKIQLYVGGVGSGEKEIFYLGKDLTADGVTVTFDANDPSGNTETAPSFSTKYVTQRGPYGELPTVSKEGYFFLGWYTGDKGGKKVEPTTLVPIGEDTKEITLYAHWRVDATGSGSGGSAASTDANALLTVTASITGQATASFAGVSDASATMLVIPETASIGSMAYRITDIGKKALAKNKKIRMLVIEAKVRTIGKKAFLKMKNVTTIELYPDNLISIGNKAFKGIKDGTEIVIHTKDQKKYDNTVKMIKNAGGSKLKFTQKKQ